MLTKFSIVFLAGWTTFAVAAEEKVKLGDMKDITRLLQPTPRKGSKEDYLIQGSQAVTDGYTDASRLAFLGFVQGTAERQHTRPGVSDGVTLDLPPQLGGPKTAEIVLVPREQNIYTVSWSLPIFNLQAIRGLHVATLTRDQNEAIIALQRETFVRAKANLLLQYELALKLKKVRQQQVDVSTSRLDTTTQRSKAGLARGVQLTEAQASLSAAKAALAQADTTLEQIRVEFRDYSGDELPENGLGLPSFPFQPESPFAPITLKALTNLVAIHEATVSTENAAFAPTVDVTAARQIKQYDGGPRPQNSVSLRANWTLLDAGSRRRRVSDASRDMFDAKANLADAETKLKTAYTTLKSRYKGAQFELEARSSALLAADQAVLDSMATYTSGSGRLLDVRNADDQQFAAELAVFKAQIDMQAIAIESLVLSGNLVAYVGSGGKG